MFGFYLKSQTRGQIWIVVDEGVIVPGFYAFIKIIKPYDICKRGRKMWSVTVGVFLFVFISFFFQKKYLKLCFYSMFQEQKSKCALQYKIRHRIYLCQNGINKFKKKEMQTYTDEFQAYF